MADIFPPTSGTTPGFIAKGKTTILWGTDGLLSSPFPGGGGFYTVLRFSEKPIVDRTKLPNGSGLTSSDIFITDGIAFELTVRDDTTMAPPNIGTTVTVVDAAGLYGATNLVYTARVVDNSWESSSKQAGERTIMADNLVLIDNLNGAAQVPR